MERKWSPRRGYRHAAGAAGAWRPSPGRCWTIRGSAGSRSPTIRAAARCCRPTGSPGRWPSRGSQVVLHLTCKDLNRNGLEAAAWRYASEGFDNILAITGDYPTTGFGGPAAPVFDLDSRGPDRAAAGDERRAGGPRPPRQAGDAAQDRLLHRLRRLALQAPRARAGAAVLQALRKIAAGAQWVIPQLGYDMRKFHEVKLMLASRGIQRAGDRQRLPAEQGRGQAVPQRQAGRLRGQRRAAGHDARSTPPGRTRGKKFFQRAGRQATGRVQGAGLRRRLPGRDHQGRDVRRDHRPGRELSAPTTGGSSSSEIQFSQPDEFFLFEHDRRPGLSEPTRINPEYRRSLAQPPQSKEVTLGYRISRLGARPGLHARQGAVRPDAAALRPLGQEAGPAGPAWPIGWSGRRSGCCYGCQDCGDCSLPDCAYLCPRPPARRAARNGPCGGSADGRCELDDKECFWARVYERLKYYGESEHDVRRPVVIYNAAAEAHLVLGQHLPRPRPQRADEPKLAPPDEKKRRMSIARHSKTA